MIIDEDDALMHYGILRKSGRYPWNSGKNENLGQRERHQTFLSTIDRHHKEGMSDTEIARGYGISTTALRDARTIARNAEKAADIARAQRLKSEGYSNVGIGKKMGINESSVRALLAPGQADRQKWLTATTDILKDQVDKKGYIDVGVGVEKHLGITQTKLRTALQKLEEEGYGVHSVKVEQLGTGNQTRLKVLVAPGTEYKELYRNRGQIQLPTSYSTDGGRSYVGNLPPLSISSKRVHVRYAEEGGRDADGVIYVRPGVKDVSLGSSRYAQVRVVVDGSHYLKGMAMYKDDLPAGVDLVFNTNKKNTGNKLDAMKEIKSDDPIEPFGATFHQIQERDSSGKAKVTSAMNLVNEQGDWDKWSKSLSTQMLSKQSPALIKSQLDMTFERKKNEFDEIMSVENPAVKRKLLQSFADGADSSAVHLKAAALPRQASHVILPMGSMKETEVYAPNYKNGEKVVLIRYPHGGKFEIPELTVNNRNPEAKKLLGNAPDAIGIHSKVAERLSGADFDGDTVLVIPNNDRRVKTEPALEGLKGFDPQSAYPAYEGMPRMSPKTKQVEMGKVSNLITDMTIKGANNAELARAVRHSMVVIDAEKHNLNYKQSAIDNGIAQLKVKYQGGTKQGGASTVISNSGNTSTVRVPERKQGYKIDPATGKKIYTETGASYVNARGQRVAKTVEVPRLSVDDAHTHSSGTPQEKLYADHSNRLKAMGDAARKQLVATKSIPYSPAAKQKYAREVQKLDADLSLALRNAPLERQAQILANAQVALKRAANPDLDSAEIRKMKNQELTKARLRVGARKDQIEITPEQWAAIQAGAITNSKLTQILDHTDLDKVKELATPKAKLKMTPAKTARAKQMLAAGYTQADVAAQLGVSVTTLKTTLGGGS
jgi:DNA-binding CsgD family transcriptional regulator